MNATDLPSRRELLVFDRSGARAVDKAAIEEFGIPGIVLMENAARNLADEAMAMLREFDKRQPARVLIVCGNGNNGGDGYALARHLHNRALNVTIASLGEPDLQSDASINFRICRAMQLDIIEFKTLPAPEHAQEFALIVDAIFGTGLDRPVSGASAKAIDWINSATRPVLAVDVPSGMDCNTGAALGSAVRATKTVTFVGRKTGFLELQAQKLLGEVVVADIGAPIELLERFGRQILVSRHEPPVNRPIVETAKHPNHGR